MMKSSEKNSYLDEIVLHTNALNANAIMIDTCVRFL